MMEAFKGIPTQKVHVSLTDAEGKTILDEDVEFPAGWDYNDILVVSSRYLCNSAKRKELSLFDMIERVSKRLAEWAAEVYGWNEEQKNAFAEKLAWFQVHRYFAFNSPVYFNVGLDGEELAHACFILDVEDSLESIYDWIQREMRIFRRGAGSGVNLSKLRGSVENVSGSGKASGPVSFLAVADISAAIIKSGGRLRRAAKLARLDCWHIDIEKFITAKQHQEKKARILVEEGVITDPIGEVPLQATNLSVGVTDEFMRAVINDKEWELRGVKDDIKKVVRAKELFEKITTAAWDVGCPGLQFHDTINKYNPALRQLPDGKLENVILGSNPCGEVYAQPNTACNLASLNLLKFYDKGKFNHKLFNEAVNVLVRAMTAISHKADYPDERIRKGTQKFHNIGIGYTNLAALLLTLGLPYDSDEAAYHVGLLTAYLQGCAIKASQKIADELGEPYPEFTPDRHKEVISIFKEDALNLTSNEHYQDRLHLRNLTHSLWKKLDPGKPTHNAQFTLLAPTGTISFLMGAADSTGIEPFYSLVTQKRLMDGKVLTLVPKAMVAKLTEIYGESKATEIAEYIVKNGTFPPDVDPSVKRLFKCAISDDPECAVSLDGRIKVAAAAQKFLSGAISITFNLPNSATPQDVAKVYMKAWESGLKGVTIYRDGSKAIQVLYSKSKRITPKPARRYPLPQERRGKIKKFRINSVKGYILTGEYPDGSLGELFVKIAKEGSTLAGLFDTVALLISIALQHGVPLELIVDRLRGSRFEPAGFTGEEEIPMATSPIDYLARYLELSYLKGKEKKETFLQEGTGMFCHKCGSEMARKGGCYVCKTCGETSGSCE